MVCSTAIPAFAIGFTHGGGFSPYQFGRWEHGWKVRPEPKVNISGTGPRQFFGMMYFDSLTHDASRWKCWVGGWVGITSSSAATIRSTWPRQIRSAGSKRSRCLMPTEPGFFNPMPSTSCGPWGTPDADRMDRRSRGLGCRPGLQQLRRALDKAQSAAVVNAALDAGITHYDTASNYGEGHSEAFLGAALGGGRDDVVIATKVGVPIPGWENSGGAAPDYVRKVLDRSLTEIGTDYIDIYMVHFPDPKTPIEDTLAVMSVMVDEGKVRQIGCSNFDPARLNEALAVSAEHGWPPFVCDQVQYSMIHREPEASGLAVSASRPVWHYSPTTRWPTVC